MTEKEQDAKIEALERECADMKTIMIGDRLRKLIGVMDILDTHRRELYGDESTQDSGIKNKQQDIQKRMTSLENDRMKIYAISATVSVGMGLLYTILKMTLLK